MIITSISDVRSENINWGALGKRFRKFREARHLSHLEMAQDLDLTEIIIAHFEQGRHRKSVNIIWNISLKWNLSLNWLLNGLGKPHDPDPLKLMPETLLIQKGAGIRRNHVRTQAEEGCFTDYVLEFVMAIDKFKKENNIPFPSWTQAYEIITALGYRKAVPPRIAPLGYIIEHQQWAEKLRKMNEKIEAGLDLSDKEFRSERSQTPKSNPATTLIATRTKRVLPSKVRYNIKRRKIRQTAIENDKTLSEAEKQRRLKIGKRTRVQGKRFIFTDPESRQYIVKNVRLFCREHQLMPAHMYSVASGQRKQHKGWRAEVMPECANPVEQN